MSTDQRVHHAGGEGAVEALALEVRRFGARVFLLASERAAAGAERLTAGLTVVGRWQEVPVHVPGEVADRARAEAAGARPEVLIAVGGGSAIGMGKALAVGLGLPLVAVPSTYAGSEATPMWARTDGGRKVTAVDPRALPEAVIYDPALLRELPRAQAVTSGLNAIAHAVDSLWAPGRDTRTDELARAGLADLAVALPWLREQGGEEAISLTLRGAYAAARAFALAGSGLHHRVCHVLGGRLDLPHAPTHAIVLPHVVRLNAPAAPAAAAVLAGALSGEDPEAAIADLWRRLGAPRALRDLGPTLPEVLGTASQIVSAAPASNPVRVTPQVAEGLLTAAWSGRLAQG